MRTLSGSVILFSLPFCVSDRFLIMPLRLSAVKNPHKIRFAWATFPGSLVQNRLSRITFPEPQTKLFANIYNYVIIEGTNQYFVLFPVSKEEFP